MTTKRTMGQCLGVPPCSRDGMGSRLHAPDCPALYPLQRQPGDEKDALTRLVTEIRVGWRTDGSDGGEEGWETRCLDLISEAREEHKRAVEAQFGMRMIAETKALHLEHDLATVTDALLDTQKRMGEVRQQNLDEGREQGHLDAFLWLRAHHDGILKPTADDMRATLAEMMDGK